MSSGSAGAEAAVSSPDNLSWAARIVGLVRRPRSTLEAIAAAPSSAGMLVLLFLVTFAVQSAFFATEVGQQALVDHWERTAIAFGQPVDDARYAQFQELSQRGVQYAALTAIASGPVAAFVLAALIFGVFTGLRGGAASYTQVLAVTVHAGVIQVLRRIVSTPIDYVRESIGGTATLVRFFPMSAEASPVARFLGLIDVFLLWWLIVLAIGVGVLYGRQPRRVAALFLGAYSGVALLLAGMMAVLGGVS